MATGFPDWQRGVAVSVELQSPDYPNAFVTRPQATGYARAAAATNTTTFVTIASYTPITGRRTYLSKASAYCVNAHQFQVLMAGSVVGEAIIGDKGWYVDYWPWGVYFIADGSKKVELKAKAIATGETLDAILFYEDVLV